MILRMSSVGWDSAASSRGGLQSATAPLSLSPASGWMLADKSLGTTEAEARSLRLYTVYYPADGTELLDEPDVAFLVGAEAWEASA